MSADAGGVDPAPGAAARWEAARALFDLAADHPPAEWDAIVVREAGGDELLQGEVLRLLAALDADHLDLDHPRFELGPPEEGAERLGAVIAPYRLVRVVGHGGMGTVYEGVRADGAYEQRVAIKFIRPILGAEVMAARFRRERQILAALEHRNIARLLDGGATERGEPYFVMEYVDGEPITAWAAARRLTIGDRLRLFLQACAAVEHAHGKFVVHRDIKPANILVTADGSVKLLDFGVAKLLGAQDGDELITVTQQRPFTPEYASPEQLRDEPASAASDLYSLGIVLYELLSGRRPYEVPSRSPLAVLRAVEVDAPRPSAAATAEAADATGETTLPKLRHLLAGELDNVVRKAIRADVETRYRSVEQLSDDIRRYLDGRPVSAQPDSLAYRGRKFVRRNRAGVAATVVVVITAAIGAALAVAQSRRANAERVWELAVNAAGNLDELGAMRLSRGDLHGSDSLLQQAVALCRTYHPTADLPLVCARSVYDAAVTQLWRAEPKPAEALLRPLLAAVLAAGQGTLPMPPQLELATAKILAALARARDGQGDVHGADSLFNLADRHFHAGNADDAPDRVETLGWHGITLERMRRYREADSVVRQQLSMATGTDASIIVLHLGSIEREEGEGALARRSVGRGLAMRGVESDTNGLYYEFITEMEAREELAEGHVDRAVTELRHSLAIAQRHYRPENPRIGEIEEALGEALVAQHHADQAVLLFDASAQLFRASFGGDHPETAAAEEHLAAARRRSP
jgi:serine/threonine protein kinase